jgi:hypothetical protein
MHESIRLFVPHIRAAGATPVLYMTWARRHAWDRQPELADAYLTIARELNVPVAPVGLAWAKAFERSPNVVLHDKDESHPNPAGSYLAACVLYATLFQSNPTGLTTAPLSEKSDTDPALLQRAAWEASRQVM